MLDIIPLSKHTHFSPVLLTCVAGHTSGNEPSHGSWGFYSYIVSLSMLQQYRSLYHLTTRVCNLERDLHPRRDQVCNWFQNRDRLRRLSSSPIYSCIRLRFCRVRRIMGTALFTLAWGKSAEPVVLCTRWTERVDQLEYFTRFPVTLVFQLASHRLIPLLTFNLRWPKCSSNFYSIIIRR